jgi:hypothetical protein
LKCLELGRAAQARRVSKCASDFSSPSRYCPKACFVRADGTNRHPFVHLQEAINILGFGPCYHMFEAVKSSRDLGMWLEADAAVRAGKEFDFSRCAAPIHVRWPPSCSMLYYTVCEWWWTWSDQETPYPHLVALYVHDETEEMLRLLDLPRNGQDPPRLDYSMILSVTCICELFLSGALSPSYRWWKRSHPSRV